MSRAFLKSTAEYLRRNLHRMHPRWDILWRYLPSDTNFERLSRSIAVFTNISHNHVNCVHFKLSSSYLYYRLLGNSNKFLSPFRVKVIVVSATVSWNIISKLDTAVFCLKMNQELPLPSQFYFLFEPMKLPGLTTVNWKYRKYVNTKTSTVGSGCMFLRIKDLFI